MKNKYENWQILALQWLILYLEKDPIANPDRYSISPHAASHSMELLLKSAIIKLKNNESEAINYGHKIQDIIKDINHYGVLDTPLILNLNLFDDVEISQEELNKKNVMAMCSKYSSGLHEYEYYIYLKFCGDLKYLGLPLKKAKSGRVSMVCSFPNIFMSKEIGKLIKFLKISRENSFYDCLISQFENLAKEDKRIREFIEAANLGKHNR